MEKLKALLGLSGTLDEGQTVVLQFVLDETRDFICHYCRLSEVPKNLENVWLAMAAEGYRMQGFGSAEVLGSVTGITEGKVSLSFAGASSLAVEQDRRVWRSYLAQLDRFRKAGWHGDED